MGENWLTDLTAATWLPAAAAFVFGLAAGWLVWGGRRARLAELERALKAAEAEAARHDGAKLAFTTVADEDDEPVPEKPVDRKKAAKLLDALEAELKAARARLDQDAEERADFAEGLDALDQAIRRVNTRLKLIIKAVKNARRGE